MSSEHNYELKYKICKVKPEYREKIRNIVQNNIFPTIKYWCNEDRLRDKINALLSPYIGKPYIMFVLDVNFVRIRPPSFSVVWPTKYVPCFTVFPSNPSSNFPPTITDYLLEQFAYVALFKTPLPVAPFYWKNIMLVPTQSKTKFMRYGYTWPFKFEDE